MKMRTYLIHNGHAKQKGSELEMVVLNPADEK
jgi:hypothetical protein